MNDWKVRLRNSNKTLRELVTFDATPDVVENRNINYKTVDPVHAPGQIYVYGNTSSRSFQLSNIRLISRTTKEATANLAKLWVLKSWTMPRFGKSDLSEQQQQNRINWSNHKYKKKPDFGTQQRGAPPSVLLLSAYSSDAGYGSTMQHINKVPVVIQQLNIPYPSDIDYIPTAEGTPMPTILNVDISLVEAQSPSQYNNFSLDQFKTGTLRGF